MDRNISSNRLRFTLQFANFYFLPTRYRVAFDNVVSLGFDTYTSHVKHRTTTKEELLFGSEFPD